MAKVNMERAIEQGNKVMNIRYSPSICDIKKLLKKPGFDAIYDAFAFGYYQGMKAAKAEMKKDGTANG